MAITPENTYGSKKTSREKCLRYTVYALVLLLLACVIAIIVMAIKSKDGNQASDNGTPKTCMTQDCIETAAHVLKNINPSIDPCEDFYGYVCEKYVQTVHISDQDGEASAYNDLDTETQYRLRELLETPVDPTEPKSVRNLKTYYQACLDTDTLDTRGKEPLVEYLKTLGGWPVLGGDWREENFDLLTSIIQQDYLRNYVFFKVDVNVNAHDTKHYALYFEEGKLGVGDRFYYLEQDYVPILEAYQKVAVDTAILLGSDPATAEEDMKNVVEFEKDLAEIMTPPEITRDTEAYYSTMKVSDMYSVITKDFDWYGFIEGMLQQAGVTITNNTLLAVGGADYLKKVIPLLQTTNKRTLANYMLWKFSFGKLWALSKDFIELNNNFWKKVTGAEPSQRWSLCTYYSLGQELSRLYVDKYFQELRASKKNVEELIEEHRSAFIELLGENTWMDEATRIAAIEKANAIVIFVAYSDSLLNNTVLDQNSAMAMADIVSGKLLESDIEMQKAHTVKTLEKLYQVHDRKVWPDSFSTVTLNAVYSPLLNIIIFAAVALEPAWYTKSFPKSMLYGQTGSLAGHEITHGFDDTGRQFDEEGNMRQWMSDAAVEQFRLKADCMVYQYGNYTAPEVNMKLNGILTQGENIADNGGVKEAYRAYRKWVDRQGQEEEPLPGVNLSHDQLFFVGFALRQCSKYRKQFLINLIKTDPHAPDPWRVIGSLSNSEDFARAFNCPLGSKMNPKHKCEVW